MRRACGGSELIQKHLKKTNNYKLHFTNVQKVFGVLVCLCSLLYIFGRAQVISISSPNAKELSGMLTIISVVCGNCCLIMYFEGLLGLLPLLCALRNV